MRLLLDENVAVTVEAGLRGAGIAADHVESLELKGASDQEVFDFAQENGYSALVTHDTFRRGAARLAALRAMQGGLCIIRLHFGTGKAGTPTEQLRILTKRWDGIERMFASASDFRLAVINGRTNRVARTLTANEVDAELRGRGLASF